MVQSEAGANLRNPPPTKRNWIQNRSKRKSQRKPEVGPVKPEKLDPSPKQEEKPEVDPTPKKKPSPLPPLSFALAQLKVDKDHAVAHLNAKKAYREFKLQKQVEAGFITAQVQSDVPAASSDSLPAQVPACAAPTR